MNRLFLTMLWTANVDPKSGLVEHMLRAEWIVESSGSGRAGGRWGRVARYTSDAGALLRSQLEQYLGPHWHHLKGAI